MESDQAQKENISLHPYRSQASKINASSVSWFVKKEQYRKI